MKTFRKISLITLLLLMTLFLNSCGKATSDVVVLYTNDILCAVNADSTLMV